MAADATFSLSFSDCLFHAPSPLLSHHSQRAQGEVGRPCPPLCAAISRTSGRQTGRGLGKRACQELGFVGQWNRFPERKVCDCRERALAAACEWSRRNPPREEFPVRGRPKGSPIPLRARSLPLPSRYECTLTRDGAQTKSSSSQSQAPPILCIRCQQGFPLFSLWELTILTLKGRQTWA